MALIRSILHTETVEQAKSRVLLIFSVGFWLGGTVAAIASWGDFASAPLTIGLSTVLPALMLMGPMLDRFTRNQVLAARVFLVAFYANIMFVALTIGGIFATTSFYLVLVPLLSGLLLGGRAAGVAAIAAIASLVLLYVGGDRFGTPIHNFERDALAASITFTLVFCAAAGSLATVVFQQITEGLTIRQARASQQALAASETKSRFLAKISHELRTPMNGVMGMLSLLSERTDLPEDVRQQIKIGLEAGHALTSVLNDVIDLSSPESAAAPRDGAPFHPVREVGWGIFVHEASARAKGLLFRSDVAIPKGLQLDGDADWVRMLVSSLVSAAIQNTDDGEIFAKAAARSEQDGVWQITVAMFITLRAPMSAADLDAKSGEFEAVRVMAQGLDGSLEVQRAGSKAYKVALSFELPAVSLVDRVPRRARSDWSATLSGLKVLVAEDDRINQVVIETLLGNLDCRMSLARNGLEALGAIQGQDFDLVLLDIGMPQMDGVQTFERLRKLGPAYRDLPVIAVTAQAMAGDRDRFLAMGMDGYVAKPFEAATLVAEIRRVLGAHAKNTASAQAAAGQATTAQSQDAALT